jgi:hypothetical protein
MTEAFYAAYGVWPGELLPLDSERAQQFMMKFFSPSPSETHKMVPCAEDEHHDKVFSGMYEACNPPNWFWICKTCGEIGKETAHVVHPKDVHEFAKLMVKFHPTEASWWKRFIK